MSEPDRRADLGCAAMLFAPIFAVAGVLLRHVSGEREPTTFEWAASLLLLSVAALLLTAGCVVWARHR